MTQVRLALSAPTSDGTGRRPTGSLEWRPTERRDVAGDVVLPAPFTVGVGAATPPVIDVAPTEPGWAWAVVERVQGGAPHKRLLLVPDVGTVVDYADLVEVDPATLDPVTLSNAWWTQVTGYAQPVGDYATNTALSTGLAGKVNAATYTAGLAGKQDVATLGATVAADATVRAAFAAPGDDGPLGNDLTKVGVVLDHGATGEFDSQIAESLYPFLDPESGRIAGVYTGYGLTGSDLVGSIGLAYSDDGVTWEKAGQLLAGSGTPGAPDQAGRTGPVVVVQGGTYYVFHIGLTAVGYEGGTKRLLCSSTPSLTSPAWTHHGVMLSPGGSGWRQQAVWHPSIVRDGNLWYCFINATGSDSKERIGVATAANLTGPWTWGNGDAPVFTADSGVDITGDPAVRRIPGGWRMDYFAAGGGSASDWYTTTSGTAFPAGWDNHPGPGDFSRQTLGTGPAGSFDELYAHKPTLLVYGGRLFHYYTAVMAGDTNRRVALACDPPLPRAAGRIARSVDAAATNFEVVANAAYASTGDIDDLTVQARAGDWIEVGISMVGDANGGDLRCDVGTVVGGAVVNYVSGVGASGQGVPAFGAIGGRYETTGASTLYQLVDADIDHGTVTVRMLTKATGGGRYILRANDPISFWVNNHG